jgi:dipeptidyl aminopeptidase/acylaminoacyl peptidase
MKKPFTVADLCLHKKITELHCVSGLDQVACTVRSVDRDNDSYSSCIWAFDLAGDHCAQLTRGPGLDASPRWSPDGQWLAFLSTRGQGAPQLHVMPRQGGDARQVTSFDQGAVDFRWRPDGQGFIVSAAVAVDPDLRGHRGAAGTRNAASAEVAWRLPYKANGVGYLLAREIHLFRVELASGQQLQLTDGPQDVREFDVSPDGRRLAFSRSRLGRFAHRTDLWIMTLADSQAKQVTSGHAIVMQPVWSHDSRRIAFTGNRKVGDSQVNLWLYDVATGDTWTPAGDELEVATPASVHWCPDAQGLVCTFARNGRHEIAHVPLQGGAAHVLVSGPRQLGALAFNGEHFAFTQETPTAPCELHACQATGEGERTLSDFNAWWRDRTPLDCQLRTFTVPDGKGGSEAIEGWILQASGSEGPQPLLSDIHGGPASYALLDFDTNVFWQVLCSRGWAVLALNAVGSASYGRDFCTRLSGHWGELDLPQHLAAVRQLQAEGIADARVAVSGKSYGGYLSAWAIGHTELFKAAVVMAPVGNIETHYGTSDGGYYADPLSMATAPRFDREVARALSPLQHVDTATTPTLFLQGKDDERCPKCQSEELFVSLMRAGDTPAELVLYPGEDHGFLGEGAPACRQDAAGRIVGWLERCAKRAARTNSKPVARKPGNTRVLPALNGGCRGKPRCRGPAGRTGRYRASRSRARPTAAAAASAAGCQARCAACRRRRCGRQSASAAARRCRWPAAPPTPCGSGRNRIPRSGAGRGRRRRLRPARWGPARARRPRQQPAAARPAARAS